MFFFPRTLSKFTKTSHLQKLQIGIMLEKMCYTNNCRISCWLTEGLMEKSMQRSIKGGNTAARYFKVVLHCRCYFQSLICSVLLWQPVFEDTRCVALDNPLRLWRGDAGRLLAPHHGPSNKTSQQPTCQRCTASSGSPHASRKREVG